MLTGLSAGAYDLYVGGSSGKDALATIAVSAGQQVTGVTLLYESDRVRGPMSISGRVTNSKGDGVARVNVYANMDNPQGERAARSFGTAKTGKDGRYIISGLLEGAHEVTINSQAYATSKPITVSAGATNANFVLQDFGSIEGQVLDAANGQPIANFDIGIGESGEGGGVPESGFGPDTDRKPYTSPDGKFRVERVEPGDVGIRAYAPGYAPAAQVVRGVRSGETSTGVTIRLNAGGIVEGHVRTSAGEPIPGVQIVAGADLDEHSEGTPDLATTNSEGMFRLDSLALQTVQILAHHEDYIDSKITVTPKAGAVTSVDIVMGHGGTVTGVVRKNGKPAAGLDVDASGADVEDCFATTETDGSYTLNNVPPGEMHVEVSSDLGGRGTLRMSKVVHVVSDRSVVVDFDLSSGTASVEGKVSSGGQPVRHARVTALPTDLDSGATLSSDADAETGEDGTYKIEGVPAGKISLLVTLERDTTNEAENSVLPQTETRAFAVQTTEGQVTHRDIDLGGGSALTGAVKGLGEGERAVVLVLRGDVTLTDTDVSTAIFGERRAGSAGSTLTKPDGAFRLSGLDAGRYTVVAVAVDPVSGPADTRPRYSSTPVTVPDSGEQRVDVRIP
jgi:hypothetical protein